MGSLTFTDVYDEHFRFVWRSLRRLGVSEADVADAAQEVFVVVHRKLDTFEARAKLSTWLFGICLRVAARRRSAPSKRREIADEAAIAAQIDPREDAASTVEHGDRRRLLEALLDELPFEQRTVFVLFELEAMTGEDIADALEIPLGTVYSRLRLARAAFEKSVQRERARSRARGIFEGESR